MALIITFTRIQYKLIFIFVYYITPLAMGFSYETWRKKANRHSTSANRRL